jgi:hypothetical protein
VHRRKRPIQAPILPFLLIPFHARRLTLGAPLLPRGVRNGHPRHSHEVRGL